MKSIKIYFNASFQVTSIDDSEVTLIQGDVESKALDFYFDLPVGKTTIDYNCRVTFQRPDASESGELYVTPLDNYYRIVLPAWALEQEGILNMTVRLKEGTVVIGYGMASVTVNEGVMPTEDTITLTQLEYQSLLDEIDTINARLLALESLE